MSLPSHIFETVSNFRDVALTVNAESKDSVIQLVPGLLYRSARPDAASETDRERLAKILRTGTVIDLRSKTEHIEAVKKYRSQHENDALQRSLSDNLIAEKLRIPDLEYVNVNLNGKGFERHLAWQLSWTDLASLATNMLLGYRIEGVKIIGEKVLQPRGLTGLATDTLEHSGPEIRQVFRLLAGEHGLPVLIHCTQGKDRTGLIVILVLLLCGVDIAAISKDYCLSERELQAEYDERMTEIASIGLDDSFARCAPDFVEVLANFIKDKYATTECYLMDLGVTKAELNRLRKRLCSQIV